MNPLCVATNGYLNGVSAVATDGYICAVVVTQRRGGGEQRRYELPREHYSLAQALREDEEIIEIILTLRMSNIL